MDNQKLSARVEALEGPDRDVLVERLISNPTLRPDEWKSLTKKMPFKKQQIAAMLGIEPASFSRILAGRPAGPCTEKLFRLLAISEFMPSEDVKQMLEKHSAHLAVISLSLSPVELVQ